MVGWLRRNFATVQCTGIIRSLSTQIFAAATSRYKIETFVHPKLSDDEHFHGTRLGFDSWADSCCAGKHAYVDSFVEGKFINASGFSTALGKLENLPIANVIYAHDLENGEVILLENHNAIYMGNDMVDSLVNPIHMEESGVHLDIPN